MTRILIRQLTETVPPLDGLRPDLPSSMNDAVDQCRYGSGSVTDIPGFMCYLCSRAIPVAERDTTTPLL